MHAIRIHENGGAEKLAVEEVPTPQPGPGEVRIRVEAAGVNFVDIYQRSGLYPVTLPFTLGQEAAGVVTAVGEGVTSCKTGDRVATARAVGAYAEEALVPAAQLVPVPPEIPLPQAAALLLQGITAHYLACDTFPLKGGDTALVHAAAGGVGLLLVQIAKKRGARVLGTVSTDEKARLAREAGADEVVVYSRDDFTAAAKRFTAGAGVDVVYDSVGKDTFMGSLDSLRPRGLFVTFGNASGPVPPFAPLILTQKGSLFFTRPSIGHYLQTTAELRVRVGATYPLAAAAEAHRALESRGTTGKLLLLP